MNTREKEIIAPYFSAMKGILSIKNSFELVTRIEEFNLLLISSYDSLHPNTEKHELIDAYAPVRQALRKFSRLDMLTPNIKRTPEFMELEETFNDFMAYFQDLAREA